MQGSDGILYFTKNDAPLGRITTDGQVLPDAGAPFQFNGNGLDAHGDDIWVTDFNNSIQRYDIPTGVFTEFPTPVDSGDADPLDVAVAPDGIVWFTEGIGQIGRLDPATGIITEFAIEGFPREINIASDGAVWFTEQLAPQAVGRLDPGTNNVTLSPLTVVWRTSRLRDPTVRCGSPARPAATSRASRPRVRSWRRPRR